MNFKIPNGHRNNSYRNEPTYPPPSHSTKPRRQKFHALMGEMDANGSPRDLFFYFLHIFYGLAFHRGAK
jgi:hypothetical protein